MTDTREPRPTTLLGHLFQGLKGFRSLILGLGVTGRHFVGSQVTVHYPRQTVTDDQLAGYRGHIELVADDNGNPRCIVCFKCMRACPSQCILIEKQKQIKPALHEDAKTLDMASMIPRPTLPPEKAKPALAGYHLDFTLCSLCGHCVQHCPAGAIRHSSNVYLASTSAKDFHMDLLARLKEQVAERLADAGDDTQPEADMKEAV